jgi:tRNA U34 5-carboxymethylaminomethyl modifying GTPase MnmE/TrmE
MEVKDITFTLKDVITIIVGISSFIGFYYALKRSVEKVSNDVETLEVKQKKDTESIMASLKEHKDDVAKSEEQTHKRISEIRDEHRAASDKLESKIDAVALHLATMSNAIGEITGYIKAKK